MPDAMDSKETEAVEMDTEITATPPAPAQNPDDVLRGLLTLARQFVNEGKPSQALQAVIIAMRTKGGEEAVIQSLNRARELYRKRLQENAAVDQLACLFAECAIDEVQPVRTEPSPLTVSGSSVTLGVSGTSILAESGRMQIVLDASSDGSSFVCLKCGGLVSNHRKDEHYAYWCCQI